MKGLSGRKDRLYLANLLLVALVVVGLFLPWLWRGYDRVMTLDEDTGRIQVRYERRVLLSPFYVVYTENNEVESVTLLYNLESNLVGLVTMISSIFTVLKYRDKRVYGYSLLVSIVSLPLFFMTLGGSGIGLGSVTYLGIGFYLEIICIFFIVIILFNRILFS
jgi:hypothetical protein